MQRSGRFKLLGLTTLLIGLLASVGGLVISQAAGQSGIRALVYEDAVRFAVEDGRATLVRVEVFNLGGKRLFDSGPEMGNVLDWNMCTESGERVARELTVWSELEQGSYN